MDITRDGKWLENFVAEVERAAGGNSISIQANSKKFNEDGHQLAEFDLIVTGRVGTADVKVLIECRDRPSAGSAPASWIEQLVGRKIHHTFDRVIAVSTTGFAPGALGVANRSGIELRRVIPYDPADFKGWLSGIEITLKKFELRHIDVKFRERPQTSPRLMEAFELLIKRPRKTQDKWIFDAAQQCKVSISDLWAKFSLLELGNAENWTAEDSLRFSVEIEASGEDLRILTKAGLVHLSAIFFEATGKWEEEVLDQNHYQYLRVTGELLSERAEHKSITIDPSFSITLHRFAGSLTSGES